MNERKDVSPQVVEELFKMADLELRAWWTKRRTAAQVKLRPQTLESEDTAIVSGSLSHLKPNLRNR